MPAAWRSLPFVAQFSSLGAVDESWLLKELVPSFTAGAYREPWEAAPPAGGSGKKKTKGAAASPGAKGTLNGWVQRSPAKGKGVPAAAAAATAGAGGGGQQAGAAAAVAPALVPPGPQLAKQAVHIVWPTLDEVAASFEGWSAGWHGIAGSAQGAGRARSP
jgi:hypothetical protein